MFSPGERLGMLFRVMGGCLSAFCSSLVLLIALLRHLRRKALYIDPTDSVVFLTLMLAEFIQALGELPIMKWMSDGVVTEGPLCTVQGVTKHIGGTGVALSSLAIAVHTFCVLVLRLRGPRYTSKLTVLTIWISLALIIAIPALIHMKEDFYGNVGYWCWVRRAFRTEQLVSFYLWLWVALLVMIITYTIIFVVFRGWFIFDNGVWYWHKNRLREYGDIQPEEEEDQEHSKAIAKSLLLYPVVYLVCIIPYSIAGWRLFSGSKDPYQFTFFAATLYSLSGTFNTLLFFFTRPVLVLPPAPESSS